MVLTHEFEELKENEQQEILDLIELKMSMVGI